MYLINKKSIVLRQISVVPTHLVRPVATHLVRPVVTVDEIPSFSIFFCKALYLKLIDVSVIIFSNQMSISFQ